MTALVERWSTPTEAPILLRSGKVGGTDLVALIAKSGAAYLVNGEGQSIAIFPNLAARHVALGNERAFFTCRPGRLLAIGLDGQAAWDVDLESKAVGRIFAGHRDDVVVLLSRRKKFLMERYAQADGTFLETRPIERRRALLSQDRRRLWMRDRIGITSLRVDGFGVTRVSLTGNGAVGESGDVAVTPVGQNELACVAGHDLRWQVRVDGRDLRPVVLADGLDADEDEYENAHLGRPVLDRDQVLVPDLNGVLHCFDLGTGALRWRFEGDHYPSAERVPTPLRLGERIGYVGTDEMLYLLARDGTCVAKHELAGPPLADPVPMNGGLVVYSEGLRCFEPSDAQ